MAFHTINARRAAGVASIATSCLMALVLSPSAANADPAGDKASVEQQIVQTQHDLEAIAEQYNDAKIQLDQLNATKAAAQQAATDASSSLGEEKQKVADTGSYLYKTPVLADAATVMTASSPQEIIDKLNTLAAISDHYGESISNLQNTQQQAATAQAEADQAATAAAATEQELAAKKTEIEAKLPALQAKLDSLSEAQRQAVLAESGGNASAPAPAKSGQQSATSSSAAPAPATQAAAATQTAPVAVSGGSGAAQGAVQAALSKLGSPYVWAAAGPNSFDCSGLTMWAYGQVGVSLPHSSSAQASAGSSVPLSALAPGDIVWMPGHVGMYIGNGQVVHAPTSGDVVKVVPLSSMGWQKGVRVA